MDEQNLLLSEDGYPNAPADIKQALRDASNHAAVAHIEQLERELAAKDERIAELSDQLDDERVRLAACGVAAMANTRESMAERITKDNPYWSASYGDVCKAVDREVSYRERIESQPSAEALVQAALEAAADYCDSKQDYGYSHEDLACAIRNLDKQQIIESCKGEK